MREMRVHVCGRGEKKRGYKIGEGGKKREILRVLDDVFVQLKLDHAGGTCTCMWKDIVY